jgi:hypothetical protein
MPASSDFLFQGVNMKTAVAFNSAILAAAWPDAPSQYQTDSLDDLASLPPPVSMPAPIETSAGGGSKEAPDSWANGVCDRCSFVWRLSELNYQVVNRELTTLRCCPNCLDQDNPQSWVGDVDVNDASVLRDARSDSGQRVLGRGVSGFNPVVINMPLMLVLGQVTVS